MKRIGHHMGSVIGKLHSLNIIHGDLTTSNFLLRRDANHIVLIDFGLAEVYLILIILLFFFHRNYFVVFRSYITLSEYILIFLFILKYLNIRFEKFLFR